MVMDFSYTFIHACVQAMNDGMQIVCYLQLTFDILHRRCSGQRMKHLTFLTMRCTHDQGDVNETDEGESNMNIRTVATTYFDAVQCSKDLQSAAHVYR